MEQRQCNAYVRRVRGHRPMIIVEDDTLDPATMDLNVAGSGPFEIVACTGPTSAAEPCPLVVDGTCPVGRPDVVVSALSPDNPWAGSVRAAWRDAGVPVVEVAADDQVLVWPAHIGAAIQRLTQAEE
jgi:hypothetical protein